MIQQMTTLREKCINALRNNTRRNEVSGTREIDMDAAADAILAAVIEHATSDEAVERAVKAYRTTDDFNPYPIAHRAAIRAAIGGENIIIEDLSALQIPIAEQNQSLPRKDGSESSRGLPEGWVMVPKEPTDEMVYEGCNEIKWYASARQVWDRMIGVAPEPPNGFRAIDWQTPTNDKPIDEGRLCIDPVKP
jgi:hypothetical protein